MKSKLAAYKEELEVNLVEVYDDANNVNCVGEAIKQYIPNMDDDDLEQFVIYKGKLMYIGENEERANVAKSLEIESGSAVTQDIVKVTDVLNKICSTVTPPADDTQPTPAECIGTRLYDKNSQNVTNWRLVIEYSNSNVEKARYGTGWFLLKSGTELSDGSKVNNDYVINYGTNEMILLSNYKEWTLSSQLAVTDSLALNVDATNLADGRWTGVTKHGDVVYDTESKALLFNEDEDTNPTGEGGYLEYRKTGLDFSDGFTFEYYFNTSRGCYKNSSNHYSTGLFIKIPNLISSEYSSALRMCFNAKDDPVIASFMEGGGHKYEIDGQVIYAPGNGRIQTIDKREILPKNEDCYLTVSYTVYDESVSKPNYDDFMRTNKVDKFEIYLNGELYSYTYFSHSNYVQGLNVWNNDSSPLFVGVSTAWENGNLYYIKGKVYSCRLYERSLSSDEVKDNYDSTVQFRSSGL